jgi:hypothetical protein
MSDTDTTPTIIDLIHELRGALGLPVVALPASPRDTWADALERVRELRSTVAYKLTVLPVESVVAECSCRKWREPFAEATEAGRAFQAHHIQAHGFDPFDPRDNR